MTSQVWSETERAEGAMCAALLHTGDVWWGACCVAQLYLLVLFLSAGHWSTLLLTCLIWAGVTWMAIRVRLDALLFDQLARVDGPWRDPLTLDDALVSVLSVKRRSGLGERDMRMRIAGAKRLYRRLVALCLIHGMCLLYECLQHVWFWAMTR